MIIISGGSGGIGQSIVPLLSGRIVVLYNKNPVDNGYKINIENADEVKEFVRLIRPSKVTLVHLAAINIDGLVIKYEEEWWDRVINVNLNGNFLLTKALLPTMFDDGWGRIIHISSCGVGTIGTIAYSSAKSALIGMSSVLSKEYGRFGITSNVLQLGYFGSGLFNKFSDEQKKKSLDRVPSKELGNPQNIVNAIEFLIKSDYVNGSIIKIDGGI